MVKKSKMSFANAKKTYLRGISQEDYQQIAVWLNDPEFNKFLVQGWRPMYTALVQEQFENEQRVESAIQFAQWLVSTDKLVGWCGLYRCGDIIFIFYFSYFINTYFQKANINL